MLVYAADGRDELCASTQLDAANPSMGNQLKLGKPSAASLRNVFQNVNG